MPMPEGDHMTMGEYQTLGGAASTRENLNVPRMMGEDTLSESHELARLRAENAALREQIATAIRLYPQLEERITSSAPDPSFGNPRAP